MKIVNIKDQSKEWHEWRKNGIGSSDIAAIVGKSPFKTAMKVYEEKKGLSVGGFTNPAMLRGNEYEETARKGFNQYMKSIFYPVCIEHETYDFMRASLDGYCEVNNAFVEIKVPSMNNFENYADGTIPDHYMIQLQWQMMVGGFDKGYFAVFNPENKTNFVMLVEKDAKMQDYLKKEALFFWDNLKNNTPPPLQQSDYIKISEPELTKIEKRYIDIDKQIKALENEKKMLKESILDYGDGGNFKTDHLTVFMQQRMTLDKDKMKKNGIDVSLYQKPAGFYYTIKINKGA